MATLVASAGGGEGAPDPPMSPPSSSSPSSSSTHNSTRCLRKPEKLHNEDEIVTFLLEHFVPTEAILQSLQVGKQIDKRELRILLTDVVRDCIPCTSSGGVRDDEGKLMAVCLASRSALFEKQMDRLCMYKFDNEQMRIAVEFLKYVFNRVDVVYECEQRQISKPVFIAIISVRSDCSQQGLGLCLLEHCIQSALDDRSDGALMLCSSSLAMKLMQKKFRDPESWSVCRIRYQDYRGEYLEPPITPSPDNHSLHVLLTKIPHP